MERITPLILPDLESGASSFEGIQEYFFTYLHLSVPTILISPWVEKGVIEHAGTNNGLAYSHSSIAGFISKASFFVCETIFPVLIDYYCSSSGTSIMASPWHPVWLSRLPLSILLQTNSVMMLQWHFLTPMQTEWGLKGVRSLFGLFKFRCVNFVEENEYICEWKIDAYLCLRMFQSIAKNSRL